MKMNIGKRLQKLETSAGLIETAADNRDCELGQVYLKRLAALRAQEGLPTWNVRPEILARLTLKDLLYRLHTKERTRLFAEKQGLTARNKHPASPTTSSDNEY